MRSLLIVVSTAALLLTSAATAHAGPPDGPGPWTDAFEPSQTILTQRTDGSAVPAPRNNPQNAVGVAETPGGLDPANTRPTAFYSLGMGGTLVLRFDQPACNVAGADLGLEIREVTFAPPDPNYPEETARVYVSQDGVNYVQAATKINRDSLVSLPSSLRFVRYVKIVDTTAPDAYAGRETPGDGIDIDGVRAVNTQNCGTFSCRASAIRVTNPPPIPIVSEPSVANGAGSPCGSDHDAIVDLVGATPAAISASVVSADTAASGSNPRASASSSLTNVIVGILPASASEMTAHAEATCISGSPTPVLTGGSSIVNLAVAGQTVNGSSPQTIAVPVLGTIYLNRQQTAIAGGETRLIQRAFEFEPAPPPPGLPQLLPSIVLGEAIADYEGAPCQG